MLARFSESKGGHGRVWNKILYVTRDKSRFFSWVVTALAKRFFPRVITRSGSKHTLVKHLVARALNPREKSATFASYYIMCYLFFLSIPHVKKNLGAMYGQYMDHVRLRHFSRIWAIVFSHNAYNVAHFEKNNMARIWA